MKRSFLFLLFGVLTLVSGQAQVMRGGVQAFRSASSRSVGSTMSASDKMIRNLQQQSRKAERAAREAAAAGRIKTKPSGFPAVVPNLDTDDRDSKNSLRYDHKIRPVIPRLTKLEPFKIKTLNEMLDKLIAREYERAKPLVAQGRFDRDPESLFRYADYAKRHGDDAFAIECIEHISTRQLSPALLKRLSVCYPSLSEYMPEISRSVAIYAYSMMVDAKLRGEDCDSLRMQAGDTLLMVTGQYNPSLNPLVVLSCVYDPSKEVERYKEVADSVTVTYDQWSNGFKDTFARDFVLTLMGNGEYATVLDYFGREPLKQFPDSQACFALDMASSAMATQNEPLFNSYLQQAFALDSVATNDYWEKLYDGYWANFIDDPSQTELADWLLEISPMPANDALIMSRDLMERYWPETEYSWKWAELSDLTPDQNVARQATLHILDKGAAMDEGRSDPNIAPYSSYIKVAMLIYDPTMIADARALLDSLTVTDDPYLHCHVIVSEAYMAAHGLDKPKEALKILKKNIKLLDDPAVTADVRDMWYDYMAALCTSLGKTKDAEKYRKLKQ